MGTWATRYLEAARPDLRAGGGAWATRAVGAACTDGPGDGLGWTAGLGAGGGALALVGAGLAGGLAGAGPAGEGLTEGGLTDDGLAGAGFAATDLAAGRCAVVRFAVTGALGLALAPGLVGAGRLLEAVGATVFLAATGFLLAAGFLLIAFRAMIFLNGCLHASAVIPSARGHGAAGARFRPPRIVATAPRRASRRPAASAGLPFRCRPQGYSPPRTGPRRGTAQDPAGTRRGEGPGR